MRTKKTSLKNLAKRIGRRIKMAHISEIWCKYCRKTIGYYVEGDTDQEEILERDKAEHELHLCPKRFEEPKYMIAVEEILEEMKEFREKIVKNPI